MRCCQALESFGRGAASHKFHSYHYKVGILLLWIIYWELVVGGCSAREGLIQHTCFLFGKARKMWEYTVWERAPRANTQPKRTRL